jgi:hypothetical protein
MLKSVAKGFLSFFSETQLLCSAALARENSKKQLKRLTYVTGNHIADLLMSYGRFNIYFGKCPL